MITGKSKEYTYSNFSFSNNCAEKWEDTNLASAVLLSLDWSGNGQTPYHVCPQASYFDQIAGL